MEHVTEILRQMNPLPFNLYRQLIIRVILSIAKEIIVQPLILLEILERLLTIGRIRMQIQVLTSQAQEIYHHLLH